MKQRNNRFAAALDYLKRTTDIRTQKELARRMGVTETTISRVLKGYVEVTEDIITKLQTASGCVFNLQWLRGEDPDHMLAKDLEAATPPPSQPAQQEPSALTSELIASLKRELDTKQQLLEAKEELIAALRRENEALSALVKEKDAHIQELRSRIEDICPPTLRSVPPVETVNDIIRRREQRAVKRKISQVVLDDVVVETG